MLLANIVGIITLIIALIVILVSYDGPDLFICYVNVQIISFFSEWAVVQPG